MDITLDNQQKKVSLNLPQIKQIIKTVLRHEGLKTATLSVVFVTDSQIKLLNKKFLGRGYATDVLAFDLRDKETENLRGDVIISLDTVLRNSKIFNSSFAQEVVLCVIHGVLHLLGFDDHRPMDIKKMRAKEQQLLKIVYQKIKKVLP